MNTDDKKISELYQKTRNQEPPPDLDKLILNAAHDAVASTSSSRKKTDRLNIAKGPFSGAWPAMASIAALLLITVILVPLVEQEPMHSTDVFSPIPMSVEPVMMDENFEIIRKQKISESRAKIIYQEKKLRSEKPMLQKSSPAALKMEGDFNTSIHENDVAIEENIAVKRSVPQAVGSSVATMPENVSLGEGGDKTPYLSALQNAPALEIDTNEADNKILTAEKWLREIHQLIADDELGAARDELDEFKLSYPNEEVPQSILAKLKR